MVSSGSGSGVGEIEPLSTNTAVSQGIVEIPLQLASAILLPEHMKRERREGLKSG